MHKRIFAIALCLLMVSAFAVTGAVSAAEAGKSNDRQYDVKDVEQGEWIVYGKLTVKVLDDGTGTYVLNANGARISKDVKEWNKDRGIGYAGKLVDLYIYGTGITIKKIGTVNLGGTLHGEGTLDKATVDKLALYGDQDLYWSFFYAA